MILTGDKLDEMCRTLWGGNWPSIVAARLKRSRVTMFRWRDSPRAHSKETKREILAVIEDQIATGAAYAQELREDLGM